MGVYVGVVCMRRSRVVLLLVLTAVGCGSPGVPRVQTGDPGAVKSVRQELTERTQFAPDEYRALWSAGEKLTAACVARGGLAYPVQPPPDFAYIARVNAESLSRGGLTIGQAKVRGYRPASPPSSPPPPARGSVELDHMVESDPVFGGGLEKCRNEAATTIFGRAQAIDSLFTDAENLVAGLTRQALASSAGRELNNGWAICVRQDGYAFASPDEAAASVLNDPGDPNRGPSQREIETASADARCQEATSYGARLEGIVRTLYEEWLAAHPGYLESIDAAKRSAVGRAKAVTG